MDEILDLIEPVFFFFFFFFWGGGGGSYLLLCELQVSIKGEYAYHCIFWVYVFSYSFDTLM